MWCFVQQLIVHPNLPWRRHGYALGRVERPKLPRILKRMWLVVNCLPVEVQWYHIFLLVLFKDGCVCVPPVRVRRAFHLEFTKIVFQALVRILHILNLGLSHCIVLLVVLLVLSARRTEQVGDPLLTRSLLALLLRILVRMKHAHVDLHCGVVFLLVIAAPMVQPSRAAYHSFFWEFLVLENASLPVVG